MISFSEWFRVQIWLEATAADGLGAGVTRNRTVAMPIRQKALLLAAPLLATVVLGAAHAAPAASGLDARARSIHARVIPIDPHADILFDPASGVPDLAVDGPGQADLPKLRRGGVGAVVLAAFAPSGPRTPERIAAARAQADAKLKAIHALVEQHPDQAELALSAADVERIRRAGKVAIIAGFLNAYAFGDSLAPIADYYRQGVRVFGFNHAGNNAYADSSRPGAANPPEEWGGLSPLGKQAVGELNRLGVIIDVSQLTPAGVLQTLALTKAPVLATHSGIKALVDAPRNLSDAELDAIKANGGVVNIVAFNAYLARPPEDYAEKVRALRASYGLGSGYRQPNDGAADLGDRRAAYEKDLGGLIPKATVASLVDAVDYAVKRIGIDHVGISSDFNHNSGIVGFNSEADAPNVTRELVARGYTEAQIRALWGGNFLRVFKAVEATSRRLTGPPRA